MYNKNIKIYTLRTLFVQMHRLCYYSVLFLFYSFSSHESSRKMRTGVSSRQQHFDNLSYVSDGRDRISYHHDPYGVPSRNAVFDRNGVILQPKELKRSRHDQNISYKFRPGQDSIYAYSNAAFRYLEIKFFSISFHLSNYFMLVILVASIRGEFRFEQILDILILIMSLLKE